MNTGTLDGGTALEYLGYTTNGHKFSSIRRCDNEPVEKAIFQKAFFSSSMFIVCLVE
jgi:hypothetical protein